MPDPDIDSMTESMRRSMGPGISLEPRGGDRHLIHTGFTFSDGDELHIVLRRMDGRWIITDDAHTLMWLSFEGFDLTEARRAVLDSVVSSNDVSFDDGRILVDCTGKDAGECLMRMVRAVLQTADLLNPVQNDDSGACTET